jgi:hypothetical protein
VSPSSKPDRLERSFSPRRFFRTLSFREFFTTLSLTVFLIGLIWFLRHSSVEWINENSVSVILTLIGLTLIIGHIFYRIEHGRPNNFIGRNFHDYIFALLFFIVEELARFFGSQDYSLFRSDAGDVFGILFVVITFIVLFELVVGMIRGVIKKIFQCELF